MACSACSNFGLLQNNLTDSYVHEPFSKCVPFYIMIKIKSMFHLLVPPSTPTQPSLINNDLLETYIGTI